MNMAMIPGSFDVEIWIQHNKHGCNTKYYWNDVTQIINRISNTCHRELRQFSQVFRWGFCSCRSYRWDIVHMFTFYETHLGHAWKKLCVVLRSVLSLCSAVNPLWLIVYWLLWHFLNNSNINYIFPSQRLHLINNQLKIAVVWITAWKTELQVLTLFGQPILFVFPCQVAAAGVTAIWSMFICGFWKYRVHDFVSSVFLVKLFG